MSSPVTAWDGCSRLSAYLAWGCISLRNVHQRTKAAADVLRAAKGKGKPAGAGTGGQKKRQRRGQAAAGSDDDSADEGEDEGADEEAAEAEAGEAEQKAGQAAQQGAPASGGSSGQPGLKDLAAFTARLRWRSHFMQVGRVPKPFTSAPFSACQLVV